MLIEYLDARALEVEERTRAILAEPVMRTPSPGEDVLIHLLGGESGFEHFGTEIVGTLSKIASDRDRRDALARVLEREPSGIIFERLFPILAPYEPNRIVGMAIARLEACPPPLEVAIRRSLAAFVGYDFDSAEKWRNWWAENDEETVQAIIIERERRLADERISRMWEQANRHLAGGPPAAYRSWLLESLSSAQATSIRLAALAEVERFVPQLATADPPVATEQQREILRPLLVRLVEMVPGEATTLRDRDPQRTRTRALNALGKFSLFRDDPMLLDLLGALIDQLPRAGFAGDTPASRLGQTAVKVAGALAAPVGASLDRALLSLLPADGETDAWNQVPTKPLELLLDSLEQVGARVETVAAIERIYEHRADSREDALEVLVLRGVPAEAADEALALFVRVLADGSGDNLRTLALNGIGRLGRPEGIPALRSAILSVDLDRAHRSAALLGIRSIGGPEALAAVVGLLEELPEGDELRPELIQRGAELCAQDQTLVAVEALLLDEEGAGRPWLGAVAERPEIAALLDPARRPKDFLASRPEAYRRFERIHAALWSARAEAALAQGDLVKVGEGLQQVSAGVRAVTDVLGGGPAVEPRSGARRTLDALELAAGQRAKVAGQLVRREIDSLWTTLAQLLEAERGGQGTDGGECVLAGTHLAWVVDSVRTFRPFDDNAPFIAGLERFAERFPLDEATREKLEALEAIPAPLENGGASPPSGEGPEDTGPPAPPPAPAPPGGTGRP